MSLGFVGRIFDAVEKFDQFLGSHLKTARSKARFQFSWGSGTRTLPYLTLLYLSYSRWACFPLEYRSIASPHIEQLHGGGIFSITTICWDRHAMLSLGLAPTILLSQPKTDSS